MTWKVDSDRGFQSWILGYYQESPPLLSPWYLTWRWITALPKIHCTENQASSYKNYPWIRIFMFVYSTLQFYSGFCHLSSKYIYVTLWKRYDILITFGHTSTNRLSYPHKKLKSNCTLSESLKLWYLNRTYHKVNFPSHSNNYTCIRLLTEHTI